MKTLILLVIISMIAPLRVYAMALQSAGANIDAEHEEIMHFLEDLASVAGHVEPGTCAISGQPEAHPQALSACGPRGGALDLRAAPQDPYGTNATLKIMTAFAGIAAQSIGSPSQAAMAQNLQTYGGQLAASANPSLSAQGGLMQEEASAVNLGDGDSAQSLATAMQGLPQESTAGLTPSPADQAWTSSLQQFGQQEAQSAAASFSQLALQALGSWLQSENGGSSSGSGTASLLTPLLSSLTGGGRSNSGGLNAGGGGSGFGGIGAFPGQSGAGAFGHSGGSTQNSTGGLGAPLAAPAGAANVPLNPGDGSASGGAFPGTSL
jgi:hypothetical protein